MAKNMDRFDFRYTSNEELWAPYRDKYPAPTDLEYELIRTFLKPFGFERDDFVETEEFRILQRELDIPDLRQTFIEFLHQVRESKGYDVKDCLPFFNSPFAPVKLSEKDDKETYDQAMEAAMVAINTINAETRERGKIYELVTVEKLVRTRTLMYLLTLAVKELDADVDHAVVKDRDADIVMADADSDAAALKTIRTMVYDKPKDGFRLYKSIEFGGIDHDHDRATTSRILPFFNSPFAPVKISEKDNKETYDQAMEAATVAINTINAETREIYELVTVEKVVRTRTLMYLLTLAVKELDHAAVKDLDSDVVMADADADSDAAALKTIRARMVSSC